LKYVWLVILFIIAVATHLSAQDGPQAPATPPTQTAPAQEPAAPTASAAPVPTTFQISGTAHSGKTPIPGASVTATNTLTGKKFIAATAGDGTFFLTGLPRGRYVVRIEFMGFAALTQEVVLNPENLAAKVDAELLLASRQQEQADKAATAIAAAGRGFQSLAVDNVMSSLAGGNASGAGAANPGDASALPMNGAGADAPTESVSVTGAQGRTQDFGSGSEEDLQDRIQEFRDRAQRDGLIGPGQGGAGLGAPGGGPMIIGRMPRNFNINQPHGTMYLYDDNSALDAAPYGLLGLPSVKSEYNTFRFGAFVGGPLNIPKIYNGGTKNFFFVGWNGSRGSTPFDSISTVPTLAERGGDFSALSQIISDPTTGQQFQFNGQPNVIDPSLITAQATALLKFIPLPNLDRASQNFHYVASSGSSSDAVNARLIHNFGAAPTQQRRGGQGAGGGRGGGPGQNNINFGLNWQRNNTSILGAYPSLNGNTGTQGLNANAGWTYSKGKVTNSFRVNYNHNHISTSNLYSGLTNVAGDAGITGVSANPFDWGIPGISFSSFGGLSDPTPRRELDQTYTITDGITWRRGKSNWRFGMDYRRILQSFRSSRNAEGSFTFTGFATGFDFSDFLLGLPQLTTLQSGTSSYNFRANSFDLYAQNDWRVGANLTINAGLRYEYYGPYTESKNQIANLDVESGFIGADVVLPGQTGTFDGRFPSSLIRPDKNNFAPRIGIAWKPIKLTVVRAGYGVNYNLAQYGTMIQNFAFQPPFADAATNVAAAVGQLTLQNGFPPIVPGTVTNNFAVDPNYRLGYVQIWNLNIQHEFPHGILLNVGYNGAKGTDLDTERAINTAGVQPFIYESSEGNSILHAGTISIRKRMSHGLGLNGTYVYSKSIDDASSVGGGGSVVVQNPFDLPAERGLSSFDQRHKFTGSWMYDLPFGDNRRFFQRGAMSHILSGWQWSGSFTVVSGLYFTPRVLGDTTDISRGVSGSLRANLVPGQSIGVANPSALQWFNVNAFCVPETTASSPTPTCVNSADSQYGDASRNSIEGPGQFTMNMSISKTIQFKEVRALELRLSANNIFNIVEYTSIGTVLNSPTFGEVTGAGTMRRITMQARYRF
jgi:outer membrane receptor protein involved in Fe transport